MQKPPFLTLFAIALLASALVGCSDDESETCSPVGFTTCEQDEVTLYTCTGDPGASQGTPEKTNCADMDMVCRYSASDSDPATSAGCAPEQCLNPCFRDLTATTCAIGNDAIMQCSPGVDLDGEDVDGCYSWVEMQECDPGTVCSEEGGSAECVPE